MACAAGLGLAGRGRAVDHAEDALRAGLAEFGRVVRELLGVLDHVEVRRVRPEHLPRRVLEGGAGATLCRSTSRIDFNGKGKSTSSRGCTSGLKKNLKNISGI